MKIYLLNSKFFVGLTLIVIFLLIVGCSTNTTSTADEQTAKDADEALEFIQDEVLEEEEELEEDIGKANNNSQKDEKNGTRIAIGYDGGVIVVDGNFQVIETFETETSAMGLAADHRHVFLNNREEGHLKLLDLGVWEENHGDHGHTYVEAPVVSKYEITGEKPTHIVTHSGETAIFYDGNGFVEVYPNKSLKTNKKPDPVATFSGVEHHGVAVPLSNGTYAVSYTDEEDPQPLPEGIIIYDEAGEELSRIPSCPRLHGEASIGSKEEEVIAFGCEGQVLLYLPFTDEAVEIVLPDEEARVGTIKSHSESPYFLANYSSKEKPELGHNVSVINTIEKSLKLVDISTPYISSMVVNAKGEGFVLGINGLLYQLDLASGTIQSELKVIDPFELGEGHGHDYVYPSLALVNDHIVITDPTNNELLIVHDNHVDTVLTLEVQPTGILSVTAF
ncbi:hypothetical protein [Alkalihalobacterium elongatum]|uniref:hypothetical protein n=1 Tax=Alkalihalobacterium elongatum TaxID=2675466 RepID=UPI001C1FA241|nr:hypothetical protein [Alkalihalobacterium elongatum]